MYDAYSRMEILLGQKGVNRLSTAKIAVFGLGGAGSYTVEALARCGVGSLTLVDHEAITVTDINRQLYALQPTIGHKKVQIAKERVHNIDEDILVHTYETYYNEDTMGLFDLKAYDYIVDAMDTVSSKILLIEQAQKYQVPVISCLDMGNKLNPSSLEIMDISRVAADPAEADPVADRRERRGQPADVLRLDAQQVEGDALRGLRANPGQPREFVDEVLQRSFEHGRSFPSSGTTQV